MVGYRNLDRIGKTLQPILLRRRKADVLVQLPQRLENRFFVPMTPEQRAQQIRRAPLLRASVLSGQ